MYELVGPDDWNVSSVFDLAHWKNGLAFKNIDFSDHGRPVIKIAELKSGVSPQTARTMADYDRSVFVKAGDMLFSWSGNPDTSIDVFRWEGEDGWLNQHIFKVTAGEGLSDSFLFFLLKWLRPRFAEIARNKQTTGLGHVTIQDLKRMRVAVPDSKEQAKIIQIIGPLQEKIDLIRQMNASLEATARAIFKEWFVDFGPTRAKAEGRAPYLAPDIWSLFPDRLDDEGKPEGWLPVPLSTLIEVNPSEPLARGKHAPYLDMASIPTAGPNPAPYVLREFGSGMRFRNGDALLARITPCLENGKTGYVQSLPDGEVGWGSTEFIVLRSRPPIPKPFAYLVARDPVFRANAIRSMTGTSGRQRASNDAVSAYPLFKPAHDAIWMRLGSIIDPMFKRIAANDAEAQTLAATRDLLLPKLMSGEVRVKDAEKQVGEAT
ncbi:restriction endonuclease subunit S [Oleisolibacter albus]|uniref:restriction endonuclease subunit S n=1 Tax=Oleisolibacter albus TaxID=2171757 RepID=UPI000DF4143A|nr:restriction endonuclease subunit S [Oleisolibacter albus]